MKHERIDRAARVWTVSRGPNGKLQEELDSARLQALGKPCERPGKTDAAETRLW